VSNICLDYDQQAVLGKAPCGSKVLNIIGYVPPSVHVYLCFSFID